MFTRRQFNLASLARVATAAVALSVAPAMAADENPYLKGDDVPVMKLLTPPPAETSDITKAELAEILSIQESRTKERAEQAVADQEETVYRFLTGMGIKIDPAKTPLTGKLFQRISDSEEVVTDGAKKGFGRRRPYFVNEAVKPIVKASKSNAYPSGHATFGTATGAILVEMLPEKRGEIYARINDYAWSRVVGGAHYRSDLEAGKTAGLALAATLLTLADFKQDMAAAKAELRAALGL